VLGLEVQMKRHPTLGDVVVAVLHEYCHSSQCSSKIAILVFEVAVALLFGPVWNDHTMT